MTENEQAEHKKLATTGYRKQMQRVCADNIVNLIGKLKDMRKTVVVTPPTADDGGAHMAAPLPVVFQATDRNLQKLNIEGTYEHQLDQGVLDSRSTLSA